MPTPTQTPFDQQEPSANQRYVKEPSQKELDADRAANPDTSEEHSRDSSG